MKVSLSEAIPQSSASPPAEEKAAAATGFAAIRSRNFRLLWLGMFIANAGTWMSITAEGWLVTELEPDRDAFWLGAISAGFAIPMLVLPPFGGAIADRFSRMRVLWVTQVGFLAISVGLAAMALTGNLTVWWLVIFSVAMGTVLAIDSPARHALLPDLVPREALTSAVSLNSVAFTGAALIGPALAGILIPVIDTEGVFVVRAFLSLATLVALKLMANIPEQVKMPSQEGVWHSIRNAASFLWADPLLRALMLISLAVGVLGRSYIPLLAVFARDEFDVGSRAFGALVACGGLGTLLGAFVLASRKSVDNKGQLIFIAAVIQGLVLLGLATTPLFGLALPLQVLSGFMGAIVAALIATLIQMNTPQALRGRVMSLYLLTVIGIPSIGSLAVGVLADATDVRFAIGLSGILLLIMMGLMMQRHREVVAVA